MPNANLLSIERLRAIHEACKQLSLGRLLPHEAEEWIISAIVTTALGT